MPMRSSGIDNYSSFDRDSLDSGSINRSVGRPDTQHSLYLRPVRTVARPITKDFASNLPIKEEPLEKNEITENTIRLTQADTKGEGRVLLGKKPFMKSRIEEEFLNALKSDHEVKHFMTGQHFYQRPHPLEQTLKQKAMGTNQANQRKSAGLAPKVLLTS